MRRFESYNGRLRAIERGRGLDDRAADLRAWLNRGVVPTDSETLHRALLLEAFMAEAAATSRGLADDDTDDQAVELRDRLHLARLALAGDTDAVQVLAARRRAAAERRPPLPPDDL